MVGALIEAIFRKEGGLVLASLIRSFDGNFDLAEDVLQDAYTKALERWPQEGIPDKPAAWLLTVARRRALDKMRRRRETELPDTLASTPPPEPEPDPEQVSGVEDERLRLIFTCCHPAIAPTAQMALALRTLCGLSTREIARAFLEPEATTAQRVVRAKKKILEARIPYEVPSRERLKERLDAVLSVLYLMFNEGYAAAENQDWLRPDLCREAIRLARLLSELLPEAEVLGLHALLVLQDSRRNARTSASGDLIPLEEQDRTLWDRELIQEGVAALDRALVLQQPGPLQIQAAIAALHATAPDSASTDWPQIAGLYSSLLRHNPSPVVELNAAVAHAMAHGLDAGLQWIADLEQRNALPGYHLLPAAKADLLRRKGMYPEAFVAYMEAFSMVSSPVEKRYLERRMAEIQASPGPISRANNASIA